MHKICEGRGENFLIFIYLTTKCRCGIGLLAGFCQVLVDAYTLYNEKNSANKNGLYILYFFAFILFTVFCVIENYFKKPENEF